MGYYVWVVFTILSSIFLALRVHEIVDAIEKRGWLIHVLLIRPSEALADGYGHHPLVKIGALA